MLRSTIDRSLVSSPPVRAAERLALAGLLLFLIATGTWSSYDEGVSTLGQTDTQSYRAIAQAAPGLPATPVAYHHAQRFWLHWIIGSLTALFHGDADLIASVAALLMVIGICCVLATILRESGVPPRWMLVLSAAWLMNPYCTRFYLAVPWMAADLIFALGFSIVLLGLARADRRLVASGLVVAAFGRQTAMALMVALWLTTLWQLHGKKLQKNDLLPLAMASCLTIGIFACGGWYASATGSTSDNLVHLIGLGQWLVSDAAAKAPALFEFLARGIVSQGMVLSLLLALSLQTPRRAWPAALGIITLLILAVVAQPLLAGPAITGNNIARLTGLAATGAVMAAGLLARAAGRDLQLRTTWMALVALGISSLHHAWSWPGRMMFGSAELYLPVLVFGCAVAGLIVYIDLRASAQRGSGAPTANATPAARPQGADEPNARSNRSEKR